MTPRLKLAAVWLVLLALVGAIAALKYADRAGSGEEPDTHWLLPAPRAEIAAIELGHAGALHRFERDVSGAWFYHGAHGRAQAAHRRAADPQAAQLIGEAFDAFGRTRIERRLALEAQGAQYGVAAPSMLIVLYGPDAPQPLAQYAVGDVAPDSFSRYVLKVGEPEVVTVANYQIENLLRLIQMFRLR